MQSQVCENAKTKTLGRTKNYSAKIINEMKSNH